VITKLAEPKGAAKSLRHMTFVRQLVSLFWT